MSIWIDGVTYTDPAAARVSAVDHGLVVGDGVCDGLSVTAAGRLAVRRNFYFISRSEAEVGLADPIVASQREGIDGTHAGRRLDEGKIRITYPGAAGPLGSGAASGPP